MKPIILWTILALTINAHAASQLAPLFESLVKYHETRAMPPDVDFSKSVPSEEIPAIIGAINSGNPIPMDAAVGCRRLTASQVGIRK